VRYYLLLSKHILSPNSATYLDLDFEHDINGTLTIKLHDKHNDFNFRIVNYPFLDSNTPSSPAYGVYMSQLILYSRTCNSYQDFLHRSVLLTRNLLSQGFIKNKLRSTLKMFFGRYHHLTLPNRISVTTMANDICRPWYWWHNFVSFLDTTLRKSWRVLHVEQEMLTLPEHLVSPMVFIEVHVILSFESLYLMW